MLSENGAGTTGHSQRTRKLVSPLHNIHEQSSRHEDTQSWKVTFIQLLGDELISL